ncbi:MAG: hypothetical protein KGQ42_10600, partial [Alphaproteobacteria bacterium]|nr:hypothetical protein [Alphaproteobacteria bacterium]
APFNGDSLTEDYELGLKIGALGGRTILARLPEGSGREALVQTRAHFPSTLIAAEQQKARWITGIALAGYDRLGWQGNIAECWMRARDRRALLSALVLFVGYVSIVLGGLIGLADLLAVQSFPAFSPTLQLIIALNALLMLWRVAVRVYFVWDSYGARMALEAIPRMIVANIIAVFAARRALFQYVQLLRTGEFHWQKTQHNFPVDLAGVT